MASRMNRSDSVLITSSEQVMLFLRMIFIA